MFRVFNGGPVFLFDQFGLVTRATARLDDARIPTSILFSKLQCLYLTGDAPKLSVGLARGIGHGLNQLMAKLYFNYSTMNAGKSTSLLQASHNYREGGMQTYLITAQLDNRAGAARIASRIGIGEPADTFAPQEDLFEKLQARFDQGAVHCVFIDESQFLTKAQVWQLARAVDDLGVPVMCYGLRVDFQGNLFPGSAALLAWADEMREVRTICHCGKKATMVIRRGPDGRALHDGEQVVIGGNESYVSLCRRHWREAVGR